MFGDDGTAGAGGSADQGDAFGFGDLFDAFFGGDGVRSGRGPAGPPRGSDAEVDVALDARAGRVRHDRTRSRCGCRSRASAATARAASRARTRRAATSAAASGEVRQVRRSILGQMVTAMPCHACECTGQPHPVARAATAAATGACTACVTSTSRCRRASTTASGCGSPARARPRRAAACRRPVRHGARRPRPALRAPGRRPRDRRGQGARSRRPRSGAQLGIETLEDLEELVVPPGTQPGQVFKLKGRGVPSLHGRGRGDLLVRIDVDVPGRLTAEEDELVRQLAELRGEEVAPADRGFFQRVRSAFQ